MAGTTPVSSQPDISESARPSEPPLATLLSQALVAFVIELDNAFEQQMPHRTTLMGKPAGTRFSPLLTSYVMYANFLRCVDAHGTSTIDLSGRTRISRGGVQFYTARMERWGYVRVERAADSAGRLQPQTETVRPTHAGMAAQSIWKPLASEIEARWRDRFGAHVVDSLAVALSKIATDAAARLPRFLPVQGYGLVTGGPYEGSELTSEAEPEGDLSVLLSRTLQMFANVFERSSDISLSVCANALRLMECEPVLVRDLPMAAGVSPEAMSMALGWLERNGYASVAGLPPPRRAKAARLTEKGAAARAGYVSHLAQVESTWIERYGAGAVFQIRELLQPLTGTGARGASMLWLGLDPPARCWRAAYPQPLTLPHFPMVLHRGGYPDGA